tara:strand:+ start:1190 stop:2332 length:1143 start_codon:yes stop_codon:yes gene_type:complete
MDRLQQMLSGRTNGNGNELTNSIGSVGGGRISPDGSEYHNSGLGEVRLLAGNSHPELADLMSKQLGIQLVETKADRFSNKEIHVQIMENIRRRNMVIIQTGCNRSGVGNDKADGEYSVNDFLMETFIMANACRLSSVGEITLVIPCFPYARQDKKDVSRAPISGRAVADLLQTVGVTRIVTVDLHAAQIGGFFSIPVDNLYAVNIMADFLRHHYQLDKPENREKYILVAPDAGAAKRNDVLASKLSLATAIMHKSRNHQLKSAVMKSVLVGDEGCVKDKVCIIPDDICDTAGTIVKASQTLMEHGASSAVVMVVHGVLSGPAIDRLNAAEFISEVIVTNTLPQEENMKRCPKLKVVDISPLLSEAVRRLYTGESISELFD